MGTLKIAREKGGYEEACGRAWWGLRHLGVHSLSRRDPSALKYIVQKQVVVCVAEFKIL